MAKPLAMPVILSENVKAADHAFWLGQNRDEWPQDSECRGLKDFAGVPADFAVEAYDSETVDRLCAVHAR